jgi:glutamyl-tRNA synthetase
MIKEGNAYADDTEQEKVCLMFPFFPSFPHHTGEERDADDITGCQQMRDERMNGIASARRDCSPEDSLARFAEMATGSPEGLRWCIRAKISFTDPNKAMRDPVIYRCNLLPHHRTGDKYKIYPTYDFCCPIVDSIEGVTHALRTNEYRDRNPQYQWMLDALKLRKVEVWDFGRLAFVYTLLSKRKLKWFVEEGHVSGWDDPRFPTVRGASFLPFLSFFFPSAN